MQKNSPPKLDTSKTFHILTISKTISIPPKKNKQDSNISSVFPPFCHILTKPTHTKSKQKTYATKVKGK